MTRGNLKETRQFTCNPGELYTTPLAPAPAAIKQGEVFLGEIQPEPLGSSSIPELSERFSEGFKLNSQWPWEPAKKDMSQG